MALVPSCNGGTASLPYCVENFTPDGSKVKIDTNGSGVVQIASAAGKITNITGSDISGGTMRIGSDQTSYANITLTTNNTLITGESDFTDLVHADGDVELGGNLTFFNGSLGKSISGYYSVPTAPLNCPDASDTVVPNPAGLTQGYYIIAASTAVGGQAQEQVASIAYRTAGGLWGIGGCCSSIAGAGRFGLNVSTDRTTMVLSNSTGAAQNNVVVYFSKLMN